MEVLCFIPTHGDGRYLATSVGGRAVRCLEEHCAVLKGYQLCWQKDADPYKMKVLRAAVETRKKRRSRAKKSEICDINTISDDSQFLDHSQVINFNSD